MSDELRDRLLGLQRYEPPAELGLGARFDSPAAYIAWRDQTARDPAAYWHALAGELKWSAPPRGLGEAGDWFPGGELNLCAHCLDEAGAPDAEVLVALDPPRQIRRFTRRALLRWVGAIAAALDGAGLRPGERVLLALPRSAELVAAVLACLRRALTCVPIDPHAGDSGMLGRRAAVAGCRAAVLAPGTELDGLPVEAVLRLEPAWAGSDREPEAPVPTAAMHPAFVLADTSGRPYTLPSAGCMLQAVSAYSNLLDGRGPADSHWLQTPAHHASFLSGVLGVLSGGGKLIVPLAHRTEDVAEWLDSLSAVPPRLAMVRVKTLLPLIEAWQSTGAPPVRRPGPPLLVVEGESVSPLLYQTIREAIFDGRTHVVQVLSRPETSGFVAGPQPALVPVRAASVTMPAPGLSLAVVDDAGTDCAANYGGLIALRHSFPGLALELQRQPLPVAVGVRARVDRAGVLWSMGEVRLGSPEQQGVAAPELEAMIAELDGVDQVAVVRFEDPVRGTRTWAYVTSPQGDEIADIIRRRVGERFGAQAVPEPIQVVEKLPYSRSGKLLRSLLRRIAQGERDGWTGMEAVTDPEVVQNLILARQRDQGGEGE